MATAPVAGGDTSAATKLRLSDGTTAIMKTHAARRPTGFFAAEAHGLRWLAEAGDDGGVHVPEVLGVDEECLILRWVEPGKASADAASGFGQALAATHAAGAAAFGAEARRLHRHAAAAQHARATPGRSSTPCAGCCPTSSWRATAAHVSERRGGAGRGA